MDYFNIENLLRFIAWEVDYVNTQNTATHMLLNYDT